MTKREILVEMLKRHEDAQAVLIGKGTPGNGDNIPLMPLTWNHHFRELHRSLIVLRADHPHLYRHLHARYLDPWRMRLEIKVTRDGKPITPPRTELASRENILTGKRTTTVIVNVWPEWVDDHQLDRALCELERIYIGEPQLPASLYDIRKGAA